MKKFGILAYPASHSLSPQMHNAVFSEISDNFCVYGREEVSPESLHDFLDAFAKDDSYKGFSVSVPHKEAVLEYYKAKGIESEASEYIGAVNTVYKDKNNVIRVDNTDWRGFKRSLVNQYDAQKKKYLVLGAGGASRAIVYALLKSHATEVYVWNRTEAKAKECVRHFAKTSDRVHFVSSTNLSKISLNIDCIINTTSVGMKGKIENVSPFPKELFQPFHSAFDIVYTPKETVFLRDCKASGGKAMSGEEMLLYQGVEQSKLFLESLNIHEKYTERELVQKMRNALQSAMQKFSHWSAPVLTSEQKSNILNTIVKNKKSELFLSREYLEKSEKLDIVEEGQNFQKTFTFFEKIQKINSAKKIAVIAEIKPASPSKGKIFTDTDSVSEIAKMYETHGVACISVLTDFTFFGATLENIKIAKKSVDIPLLRKDFIIDKTQIKEAYECGAGCVLLMRSVLSAKKIEEYIVYARKYKLDCLVEVHDEKELRDVLENTSAMIIGVNTRDLKTLKINPKNFQVLLEIAKTYSNFSEKLWIAESGISSMADIMRYASQANAVLVGTGILLHKSREKRVEVIKNLVG